MNDRDFELYKEVMLSLLNGFNITEGKTGYAYDLVMSRLEEVTIHVFLLLKKARDQQPDEEEL